MSRQRTIIGIGEALLAVSPDRSEPAGLAAWIPINATRLGHRGVAIARLGQDKPAAELLDHLRAAELVTSHLQSDPDLATGRVVVRPIGTTVKRSMDARSAFDNLQWDFDLADVAQEADAVVFGGLAQRSSQTWSTVQRFLSECASALRLYDLVNRPDDDLDRGQVQTALNLTDAAVMDLAALHAVHPAAANQDVHEALLPLLHQHDLAFVVMLDQEGLPTVFTANEQVAGRWPLKQNDEGVLDAWIVALLHGVLSAWDFRRSADIADRVAEFSSKQPLDEVPADWLAM